MAEVRLHGLTKSYGRDVHALVDFNLIVPDGEFLCVLGPSGSGKSTLLKLIAGIEESSEGQIHFDDEDVTQTPPERRDVAMVFQSYALYPTMSVFDNLAFPLRVRRVARAEIRQRVQETAELLGIAPLLKRRPRELSGGERQRVALGRAMIRDPKVFLMDEPMSNLDVNLRSQMRLELKRLHEMLQATFIYVTHDQDDALAMGDRVAIVSEGRLQQCATPHETYTAPANRFVASFIGRLPMNFFEGTVEADSGTLLFRNEDVFVPLSADLAIDPGTAVTLGLRPESIQVVPAGDPATPLSGIINLVEVVQPNVYANVQLGQHAVLARVPDDQPQVPTGHAVGLRIMPERAHIFDPETGTRLN